MRFIQLTNKASDRVVAINLDLVTEFSPLSTGGTGFLQSVENDGEQASIDIRETYADIVRFIDTHVAKVYDGATAIAFYVADREQVSA